MKTKQFLLTSTLLIAVALISCKKAKSDSNNNGGSGGKNQVSYTINGGTFHNQPMFFSSDPKATDNGAIVSGPNYLQIKFTDAPPGGDANAKNFFALAFNKTANGTANVYTPIPTDDSDDIVVAFGLFLQQNGKRLVIGQSDKNPKDTPGTITITKFESVGGTVEGTFKGTLIDATGVKYTITNGSFVAIRRA